MSSALEDYFNRRPRLGCLSTSNKQGQIDTAYFGSPVMVDETTIVMGLGNNRTFAYLQENPYGVFMVMEPGATLPQWKGIRLYVKMTDCYTSGAKYDSFKETMRKAAGDAAAKMVHAVIYFTIYEIRPLADFGQGWEKSISQ